MQIIELEQTYLDRLVPIFDAYRQFYGRQSDLKSAEEFLLDRLEADDTKLFVAVDKGELFGFSQFYFSLSSVSAQRILIINDLYVCPEHRRKGVGFNLLGYARSYAQEYGFSLIKIETQIDNLAAQRLYENAGFVRHVGINTYFESISGKSSWAQRLLKR